MENSMTTPPVKSTPDEDAEDRSFVTGSPRNKKKVDRTAQNALEADALRREVDSLSPAEPELVPAELDKELDRVLEKHEPVPDELVHVLRARMGLTKVEFARLVSKTERSVTTWEKTHDLTEPTRRTITEVARLFHAVQESFLDGGQFAEWLRRVNRALGGRRPIDLIAEGKSDMVWKLIHLFEIQLSG